MRRLVRKQNDQLVDLRHIRSIDEIPLDEAVPIKEIHECNVTKGR